MNSAVDIGKWQHSHDYHSDTTGAERRTWAVVAITASMMLVELISGWLFHSMAVLADGWHMSTHAVALSLAGIAFAYSRRSANDARFAFGPWKIEALGGYTGALLLVGVALYMAWQSIQRLYQPLQIQYAQALVVAVIGLAMNLVCAWILRGNESHSHAKDHVHGPSDLNSRAAYLHVIADALTSVLAIVALVAGRYFQIRVLDPIMGIVGGVLISIWAVGLIRESSRVLLDREMDHEIVNKIRTTIEADGVSRIYDLHVWRIGKMQFACALAVVSGDGMLSTDYRERLRKLREVTHLTIEVNQSS